MERTSNLFSFSKECLLYIQLIGLAVRCIYISGSLPYISMGENWLFSYQGVNLTNWWSCDPTSSNEQVTCFLSQNNDSSIISSLVWLYHSNRLVVPSNTFLLEKIGYVPTKVFI